MRILHAYKVYVSGVYGGVPAVIAMLAKLSQSGFQTLILVARSRGFAREYSVDGIPVIAGSSIGTYLSTPLALSFPFKFARLVRKFDIAVHHAPFPLTDLGIFLMPKDVALVVHWHAEVIGRPFLMKLLAPLVRHSLRRADKIIVSDKANIENSPFLKFFAEKCVEVPYGCDVEYWAELTSPQCAAVDKLRQLYPRLVVAVGRLVSYKGYDVLLRAMQLVDAQAIIIGDGPLKASLIRLTEELGIADRVKFVGVLQPDEVKQYVHAARVLAFSSVTDAEAFGIIQIEAMSAGRPIVNTNLPTAVPNVARHEKEGLTVPPSQPNAFAGALRRLLDEPDFAQQLGDAGRARARSEYSQSAFLSRIEAVYKETLRLRRSLQ